MLILSRKVDEAIILELPNGEEIEVVLTEYDSQSTKVGINVPSDIKIWREELLNENT